jgi:hypothetical protein
MMKSARRWFAGTSGVAGFCVVLLFSLPESESPARTEVRGRATYKGRPVTSAAVAFVPITGMGEHPSGPVDDSGCFLLESNWQKERHAKSRYRMYFIPFRQQPITCELPARYTDPWTSGLEVSLGAEPTYIAIDLKD